MPRSSEEYTPATGTLSLHSTGIEHVIAKNQAEYLLISPDVPYPLNPPDPLSALLLPEVAKNEDHRVLELPEDYISLGNALNEALSQASERGQQFLEQVFSTMGHMLRRSILSGQGTPESLSYEQVLLDRESFGVKLLPPIVVVSERNVLSTAVQNMIGGFKESIQQGAPNEVRARQALGFTAVLEEALQP